MGLEQPIVDHIEAFLDSLPEVLQDKVADLLPRLEEKTQELNRKRKNYRRWLDWCLTTGQLNPQDYETWMSFAELVPLQNGLYDLKQEIASIQLELGNILFAKGKLETRLGLREKNPFTDLIAQAKQIDVAQVFPTYLEKKGNRRTARCPFHKEDTPSFFLYDDNTWHCFGCGKHGYNAIDFVMAYENLDFVNAVRRLA